MDYHSGHNWLLHGEPEEAITEEYLIDTIKPLVSEGVFNETHTECAVEMGLSKQQLRREQALLSGY